MASAENIFLIDSCPVEVCDNIRIDRCQIYPKTATDDAYWGQAAASAVFSTD